ncbi:MAG: hypothetical protein LBI71_11490 [Enterobacteriaceae bacterium]|jgi:hypoxanthine phosphoribosyltransferase|nr:hypothetical protein [Enterobacteriaceae bacterium]
MSAFFSSVVDFRAVGLLGELRGTFAASHLAAEIMALPGLVTTNPNFIGSRGMAYYEPKTCGELLATVKNYAALIMKLQCTDKQCVTASKYILADHCLVKLLRIIDCLIGVPQITNDDLVPFIDGVKACAEIICSALMGRQVSGSVSSLQDLQLPAQAEHQVPRTFIEGDNHLLTLAAAQIDACPNTSVVGVMLGGAAAAAITAVAWRSELNLVKVSRYDDASCNSRHIWGRRIPSVHSPTAGLSIDRAITIIDDNCGTGDTLRQASHLILAQTGIKPKIRATELHWEKLLRTQVYGYAERVFTPETLDVLTPWCFRHHKVLNHLAGQRLADSQCADGQYADGKSAHTTAADWVNYSYSLLSVLHDTLPGSAWASELLAFLAHLMPQTVNVERPIDAFKDIAHQCPECLSRNR